MLQEMPWKLSHGDDSVAAPHKQSIEPGRRYRAQYPTGSRDWDERYLSGIQPPETGIGSTEGILG